MGLITKQVETIWMATNKQQYVDKGYSFTKFKDKLIVDVKDLSYGSGVTVIYECDECKAHNPIKWQAYISRINSNKENKIYCMECANKLFVGKAIAKSRLKSKTSKNFKQACYDCLPKDIADNILNRWDYKKNIYSPEEICSGTDKRFWFKCLDNPNHESELRYLYKIFANKSDYIGCNQCRSVANIRPDLVKYFVDIKDSEKYSCGSTKLVNLKCPDCGFEKSLVISDLIRNGFSCNKCSDNLSYPEKFVFDMFNQLNIKFIYQLTSKHKTWCNKFRYDFYLPDYNTICEVHGAQHYLGWCRDKINLKSIKENDSNKKKLALSNGINPYIEIDASESTKEWLKNSILKSGLCSIFDLSIIDWNKCEEYALSNITKRVCDLWNNGIQSSVGIAYFLKYSRKSVVKALNFGSDMGWCDYKNNHKITTDKKVVCLNTGGVFSSMVKAAEWCDCGNNHGISAVCRNKRKTCGKHPTTGEALGWMYYDEYIKQNMRVG